MLLNNCILHHRTSMQDVEAIVWDCVEEKFTYSGWYEVVENMRWPVHNTVKFSIEESVVDCAWDCANSP